MADFVEVWDLRNRLILDGLYPMDEGDPIDPLKLERKICGLAAEHYGWKEPEPHVGPYEYNDYLMEYELANMTPIDRIDDALSILLDWDGCRNYRGLGTLIDEVRARLAYPTFRKEN